jgi:hypothetical protein
MKKLMVTLSTIGILTTQTMATTTMISVKGKKAQQDQRVIKVTKDSNDRHTFRLCPSSNAVIECQQIGSGSFSSSELQKKIQSEEFKKYAKGVGVGLAAVVGAIFPFTVLGGIPTLGALGIGIGATAGGSATGGTAYALADIIGRSPLEHHEAQSLLALISEEQEKIGVEDFDEVYELVENLLSEVEEERTLMEVKIATHINNSARQGSKNISHSQGEKLNVIQSVGR